MRTLKETVCDRQPFSLLVVSTTPLFSAPAETPTTFLLTRLQYLNELRFITLFGSCTNTRHYLSGRLHSQHTVEKTVGMPPFFRLRMKQELFRTNNHCRSDDIYSRSWDESEREPDYFILRLTSLHNVPWAGQNPKRNSTWQRCRYAHAQIIQVGVVWNPAWRLWKSM